ncbi:MAG TPA: FtsW/RodA/SpoVE family cell cycle protein [bacterium]|nr:FtsW/RodA/SpoVE family cell cycle protein [bacterium]HQL63847.1 FtsW/RodA/SpoVE family cell cycle protein [bacterium]
MDAKTLRNVDYLLLLNVFALTAMGVILIAGATCDRPDMEDLWIRQTLWIGIGLAGILCCLLIRVEWLLKSSWFLYIVGLGLLVAAFYTRPIKGAHSWILVPGLPLRFQPSEFMKLFVILFLAHRLARHGGEVKGFWGLFEPLLIGAIPAVMTLAQPDLGTAMIYAPITLIMMYIAGLDPAYFLLLFSPFLGFLGMSSGLFHFLIWLVVLCAILAHALYREVTLPVFVTFGVLNLGTYVGVRVFGPGIWEQFPLHWKNRIYGYMNPTFSTQDVNWNAIQSKIAVGSGGFWGHGWGQGTQSRLQFLPEVETDFVFSVMAEQWGFLGCVIFLGLITFLIARGLIRAQNSRHLAGALVICGVMSLYAGHVIINIGMAMGLLPITGLPLTFVSKGGSFMLTNLLAMGLVLSLCLHESRGGFRD